jgi:hypothetical protein
MRDAEEMYLSALSWYAMSMCVGVSLGDDCHAKQVYYF